MKLRNPLIAMLLAASVAGCQQVVPIAPAFPTMQLGNATGLSGVWQGTYSCAQGATGVTLTLDGDKLGNVTGIFEFYPLKDHPGPASGKYKVYGKYYATMDLVLKPNGWITEPPAGYVPVSLFGRAVVTGYRGTIPECGNAKFDMTFKQSFHKFTP